MNPKKLLISLFAACAAVMMWWIYDSSFVRISVAVEPGESEVVIFTVPDDAREETMRRFFAECRGEAASRSFLRYVHHDLMFGRWFKCPVKAGHFSVRLKRGMYVIQAIAGKGFEDLRLVNVDGAKTLDFSHSVFDLSKTRLY